MTTMSTISSNRRTTRDPVDLAYFASAYAVLLALFVVVPAAIRYSDVRNTHITDANSVIVSVVAVVIAAAYFTWKSDGGLRWRALAASLIGSLWLANELGVPGQNTWADRFVALLVGSMLALAVTVAAWAAPKSLARVVIFAFAIFVVDRIAGTIAPLKEWLEQVVQQFGA